MSKYGNDNHNPSIQMVLVQIQYFTRSAIVGYTNAAQAWDEVKKNNADFKSKKCSWKYLLVHNTMMTKFTVEEDVVGVVHSFRYLSDTIG